MERSAREGVERDVAALQRQLEDKDHELSMVRSQAVEAVSNNRALQSQVGNPGSLAYMCTILYVACGLSLDVAVVDSVCW